VSLTLTPYLALNLDLLPNLDLPLTLNLSPRHVRCYVAQRDQEKDEDED
jgi:hypothetical protein